MAKPTPNDLILDQVNKIIHGQVTIAYENTPGMCLAVTRQVIEKAFKRPSHWLYDKYVHDWVQPEGYDRANGHWARDFERSAKLLGWAVSLRDSSVMMKRSFPWCSTHSLYLFSAMGVNLMLRPIS